MHNGNPNQRAMPMQPASYERSSHIMGGQNPYGYGYQRTAGQLAPQAPVRPGQMNHSPAARVMPQQQTPTFDWQHFFMTNPQALNYWRGLGFGY